MLRRIVLFLLVIPLIVLFASCGGGSKPDERKAEKSIRPETGGTVALAGGPTLTIPPNTVTQPAKAVIAQVHGTPGGATSLGQLSGQAYEISIEAAELAQPVRLTFPYPPLQTGQVPILAFYDAKLEDWEPVDAVNDPASRTLTLDTPHLSLWALFLGNGGKDSTTGPEDSPDYPIEWHSKVINSLADGSSVINLELKNRTSIWYELRFSEVGGVTKKIGNRNLMDGSIPIWLWAEGPLTVGGIVMPPGSELTVKATKMGVSGTDGVAAMLSLDIAELFVRLTAGKSIHGVSTMGKLDVPKSLDLGGTALGLFNSPSLGLLGSGSKLMACGLSLTDSPEPTCDLEGAAKLAVDAVKSSDALQQSLLDYLKQHLGVTLAKADLQSHLGIISVVLAIKDGAVWGNDMLRAKPSYELQLRNAGKPPPASGTVPLVQKLTVPRGLEPFQPAIDLFLQARASGDLAKAREAFWDREYIALGNWGGAGTTAEVPLTDDNLRVLLSPEVTVAGIASQIGAGAPSPCPLCQPAYGLLLRGLRGRTLQGVRFGINGSTVSDRTFSEDESLLVFRSDRLQHDGRGKLWGLAQTGPFQLVTGAIATPSTPSPTERPAGPAEAALAEAVKVTGGRLTSSDGECRALTVGTTCVFSDVLNGDASRGWLGVLVGRPQSEGTSELQLANDGQGRWIFLDVLPPGSGLHVTFSGQARVCSPEGLRIRSGPGTGFEQVGLLTNRAVVSPSQIVGSVAGSFPDRRPGGGWLRIATPVAGWISSDFVEGLGCR